jgi:hypothetical protein
MPHKQKENHDHSSKSKKERQKAKEAALARKQAGKEAAAAALEAEKLLQANTIALAEGHGAYEIGCEPEPELPPRFNVKKRSKKHLRNDLRKQLAREEEEQRQAEEEARLLQQQEEAHPGGIEEETEELADVVVEYLVYICECCDKKYLTQNQFRNHVSSKRHQERAVLYEELGLIVTEVELRGENDNQHDLYNDDEDDDGGANDGIDVSADENFFKDTEDTAHLVSHDEQVDENSDEDSDEDEEYMEEAVFQSEPKVSLFAALAFGDDDSSNSSSSDSASNDEEEDEGDRKHCPLAAVESPPSYVVDDDQSEEDDDIDFDEIIYQNRRETIQQNIDAARAKQNGTSEEDTPPPLPLPFETTHDPEKYNVNENRLVEVQYRLRKRLAAKGIERNTANNTESPQQSNALDAIAMGQTLLQQLMEANIDTLQAKLDAYRQHKVQCQLLTREFVRAKGNSKALPAQYVRKQDAADNAAKRAIVHHAGSHYHMQASRSMQFGRSKGLMARHSSQGARLQASRQAIRMANAETTRMQSGGVKKGKKSKQKAQGEAGGSKKSGGTKGGGGADK